MFGLFILIYNISLLLYSVSVGPTSCKFLGTLLMLSLSNTEKEDLFSSSVSVIGKPFTKPGR